jgi:hypothetical protein
MEGGRKQKKTGKIPWKKATACKQDEILINTHISLRPLSILALNGEINMLQCSGVSDGSPERFVFCGANDPISPGLPRTFPGELGAGSIFSLNPGVKPG